METKSNYKEVLIGILVEINRLVTEYIKVQKDIFNPPVRVRIPFKRNNYDGLYEKNKNIQTDLYETIRRMHNNKKELSINPFIYGGDKRVCTAFSYLQRKADTNHI